MKSNQYKIRKNSNTQSKSIEKIKLKYKKKFNMFLVRLRR